MAPRLEARGPEHPATWAPSSYSLAPARGGHLYPPHAQPLGFLILVAGTSHLGFWQREMEGSLIMTEEHTVRRTLCLSPSRLLPGSTTSYDILGGGEQWRANSGHLQAGCFQSELLKGFISYSL